MVDGLFTLAQGQGGGRELVKTAESPVLTAEFWQSPIIKPQIISLFNICALVVSFRFTIINRVQLFSQPQPFFISVCRVIWWRVGLTTSLRLMANSGGQLKTISRKTGGGVVNDTATPKKISIQWRNHQQCFPYVLRFLLSSPKLTWSAVMPKCLLLFIGSNFHSRENNHP